MTEVYYKKEGDFHCLSAHGHAKGFPEVCHAVSILLYALYGFLLSIPSEVKDCVLSPGEGRLSAGGDVRTEAAFSMAVTGLFLLSEQFPEALSVKTAES